MPSISKSLVVDRSKISNKRYRRSVYPAADRKTSTVCSTCKNHTYRKRLVIVCKVYK